MNTQERREHINSTIELLVDQVNDTLQNLFEAECQRVVNKWHERWPNHTFTIELSMGAFIAQVNPPVCGQSFIPVHQHMDLYRGAGKELIDEWITLNEWRQDLNFTVFPNYTGEIKSP